MNKIDIALQIINSSLQGGIEMKSGSVEAAFYIADKIENESVKRFLYIPEHCPRCTTIVVITDLSTGKLKTWRISCECTKKQSDSMTEAILEWWEAVNA